MDVYDKIIRIIDVNIIYCLFPLTLAIILIETGFKNRFQTKKIFNLIRWIIILYAIVTLLYYVYRLVITPEQSAFLARATGPYWMAYWVMLFCSTLLPLLLIFKKLAKKRWYVLIVCMFIKIGSFFEIFVITVTSFHRDYLLDGQNYDWWNSPLISILLIFLQGFLLALLLLGGFESAEKVKLRNSSVEKDV